MSEAAISKSISDALDTLGVMHFRIQCGKVKVRGGWMQLAPPGFPDRWTELGFLETKTLTGKLGADQVKCHDRLRDRGHRVAVVRSASEAVKVVAGWRDEDRHERAMGWT